MYSSDYSIFKEVDLLLKSSSLWNYFKWLLKNLSVHHEAIKNFMKNWIKSRESSKSSKNCSGTAFQKNLKEKNILRETIDHINCTPTTLCFWHKYHGTQHKFDQDSSTREAQRDHKHLDLYPSCNIVHAMVAHPPLF